jgi:hypothetical protein
MRQRTANEKAIGKTLFFLQALQSKCEGLEYQEFTTTMLHKAYMVSKSTFSTCVKLGIVKKHIDRIEWGERKSQPRNGIANTSLSIRGCKERSTHTDK